MIFEKGDSGLEREKKKQNTSREDISLFSIWKGYRNLQLLIPSFSQVYQNVFTEEMKHFHMGSEQHTCLLFSLCLILFFTALLKPEKKIVSCHSSFNCNIVLVASA